MSRAINTDEECKARLCHFIDAQRKRAAIIGKAARLADAKGAKQHPLDGTEVRVELE